MMEFPSILSPAAASGNPKCYFFDPSIDDISIDGCRLVESTDTSFKCACNHMTDFMVFLTPDTLSIQETNYDVLDALSELNS